MKIWNNFYRLLTVATMAFCFAALPVQSAWSADLQSAKVAGQVGEKPDGYLGVVENAPGIMELVNSINERRRAAYQDIAQKNAASLQAVEQMAGQKAIEKTPNGQYIMNSSGQWMRK